MYQSPKPDNVNGRRLHDVGLNILSQPGQNFAEKTMLFASTNNNGNGYRGNGAQQSRSLTPTWANGGNMTNHGASSSPYTYPFPNSILGQSDDVKTKIHTIPQSSLIVSAHAALKGKRPTMEDDYIIAENVNVYTGLLSPAMISKYNNNPDPMLNLPSSQPVNGTSEPQLNQINIYSVMDGHGGSEAAKYARIHLVRFIVTELQRGFTENYGISTTPKTQAKKAMPSTERIYSTKTDSPHADIETALRHAVLRLDEAYLLRCIHEQLPKCTSYDLKNTDFTNLASSMGGNNNSMARTARYNQIPQTNKPNTSQTTDTNQTSNTPRRPANGCIINGVFAPNYGSALFQDQNSVSNMLYHGDSKIPNFNVEQLRTHFINLTRQITDSDGTTLCAVVLHPKTGHLWSVNVGDTRSIIVKRSHSNPLTQKIRNITSGDTKSVISNNNSTGAISLKPSMSSALLSTLYDPTVLNGIPLSTDHKATCPSEIRRIEENGGVVAFARVNGELAVARALGDASFKVPCSNELKMQIADVFRYSNNAHNNSYKTNLNNVYSGGEEHSFKLKKNQTPPLIFESGYGTNCPVTADPEICHYQLGVDDVSIVIACDGVWDVFTNQMTCEVVSESLFTCLSESNHVNMDTLNGNLSPQNSNSGSSRVSTSYGRNSGSSGTSNLISYNSQSKTTQATFPTIVQALTDAYMRFLSPPSCSQIESAAHSLAVKAIQSGSMDNVSCILVYLQHLTMQQEFMKRTPLQGSNNTDDNNSNNSINNNGISLPPPTSVSLPTTSVQPSTPIGGNTNSTRPYLNSTNTTPSRRNDMMYDRTNIPMMASTSRPDSGNISKVNLGLSLKTHSDLTPHPGMAPLANRNGRTGVKYPTHAPVPFSPPPPAKKTTTRTGFHITGPMPMPNISNNVMRQTNRKPYPLPKQGTWRSEPSGAAISQPGSKVPRRL